MLARRLIKFISAFLFAVIALVGLHFGAWFVAADLAQEKLIASINNMAGFRIEVGALHKSGYPENIKLNMEDVIIHWKEPNGKQAITLRTGNMAMSTDFLAQQRLRITFDKNQQLIYRSDDARLTYNVLLDGGTLSIYQHENVHEMRFDLHSMTVMNAETSTPVLKTGDAYLSRESGNIYANSWLGRMTANRITLGDGEETYKTVSIDSGVDNFPRGLGGDLIAWAFSPQQRERIEETIVDKISNNNTTFEVNEFRIDQDDFWITMRGDLQLDARARPEGSLSLTTNMPDPLMHYLRQREIINDIALAQNKYIVKMLSGERDHTSLRFECTDGNLSLQGAPVGVVPPLLEWSSRG